MQTVYDSFSHQPTMRDVFFVLFKHKLKIIFSFLFVITAIGIFLLLSQKVYQSEAKLFINLGRETVTQDSDSAPGRLIQVTQTMENQINSEIEILKSQELALQVAAAIGADAFEEGSGRYASFENKWITPIRIGIRDVFEILKTTIANLFKTPSATSADSGPTENEKTAVEITDNLTAEVAPGSNIIKLFYETRDPYLARDVLDRLINLYLEKHNKLVDTQGAFDFFKKESDRLRQQLETTEKKLADLKNATNYEVSSATAAQLQNTIYDLKQREQDLFSTFTENSISELQNDLSSLKQKEQELLSTFTENSPPVREIRRQITQAENSIQNQQNNMQNSLPVKEIRRQIAQAENSLQKQQNHMVALQISQLEREKEMIEKNYRKYNESLEQARIDQALEKEKISNIRVAQIPTVPIEPLRPDNVLILCMGFFVAIFGSIGLAIFVEYTDNTLQRPEQTEGVLHLPVLGSIQKMEK